jgi:hypothetical protein
MIAPNSLKVVIRSPSLVLECKLPTKMRAEVPAARTGTAVADEDEDEDAGAGADADADADADALILQ